MSTGIAPPSEGNPAASWLRQTSLEKDRAQGFRRAHHGPWWTTQELSLRGTVREGGAVTEQEWDRCTEPQSMLTLLRGKGTERRLRLFICACCRHHWAVGAREDRARVEVAERFADGEAGERHLAEARRRARSNSPRDFYGGYDLEYAVSAAISVGPDLPAEAVADSLLVAAYWTGPAGYDGASIRARYAAREAERARQATTVRCLFGNPFRPVSLDPAVLAWNGHA